MERKGLHSCGGGSTTIEVLKRKSLTATSDTNKLRLLCGGTRTHNQVKHVRSKRHNRSLGWAGTTRATDRPKEWSSTWTATEKSPKVMQFKRLAFIADVDGNHTELCSSSP